MMRAGTFGVSLIAACAVAASPARTALARSAQYKKANRDAITRIATGKAGEAVKRAKDYLKKNPKDLESIYILALAHASMNEPAEAMDYVKKAVEGGLPVERFLAGPRKLVASLTRTDEFEAYAARRAGGLVHGPVLGRVTDSSASFWVRTAGEVPVQVAVKGPGGASVKSKAVRTSSADDFTAVAEVDGLEAGTKYSYEVLAGGKTVRLEPRPSFRTFPKQGNRARFQVVFGGGAGYTPWHERMWDTIRAREPVAMLLLGDNVYIDTPKVPETQRYCYYRRQSRPEYRRFAASSAVYAIWDDHDFGTNDCTSAPEVDQPPWKPAVWKVFTENWANPDYGHGGRMPGCWFDFSIADVDFFMVDGRCYRTNPKKEERPTMLGPEQKRWLFGRLAASKATFKVLAGPVPWAKGTKGGSKDTWDGFPEEREEIFSFLEKNRIDGVVLLSADRHRSDAWKIERPGGYALYEFESSRLTNVHTHGAMRGSLFSYNKKCSFGLLTFDTTRPDPELTYEVVNIDNEVIHTLKLRRSQLSHASRR